MANNLLPKPAAITQIKSEGQQTKLFVLKLINSRDRTDFRFKPGQFIQLSIPGFGEVPFSIASSPTNQERLAVLVQRVGSLTTRLFQAKVGDRLGLRGPLGNGFPSKKFRNKKLVFVSGGCGIAPMHSLMEHIKSSPEKFKRPSFFYGCKTPQELYFAQDYPGWKEFADLHFIVEKGNGSWKGPTGVVTDLFKDHSFKREDRAVICGPPIMIKFVVKELTSQELKTENIYLSLERRMSCGVGVCQHCVIGSKYVCKDGPVFSLAEIRQEEPNLFND